MHRRLVTHRRARSPLRMAAQIVLCGALLLALLLAPAPLARPLHAQEGAGTYTVQAGDSLSAIAARYGVTLDSIIAANGIADPSLIQVGQVLIIPGASTGSGLAGVPTTQVRAQPGDTIASIAQRHAQDAALIASLNGKAAATALFPGQPVHLPLAAAATVAQQEPLYFGAITALALPTEIEQGRTGRIVIESSRPLTVTAVWNGLQLPLAPVDVVTRQVALLPAPALIEPGDYPVVVSYTTRAGVSVSHTFPVAIVDGGYQNQVIAFTPEVGALLDPVLVAAELEKATAAWSGFTTEMLLRDPFARPIGPEYATTSPFGIRRFYDGGLNTSAGYHAGQDFGAGVGVLITSPSLAIVSLAEQLQVRGNAVILDHGRGVYTGYWHMSEIRVQTGQVVQTGDVLGLVGSTGLSTGAHLHWEMRVYGVAVDPMQFLNEAIFP